jgi:hypothetical protein
VFAKWRSTAIEKTASRLTAIPLPNTYFINFGAKVINKVHIIITLVDILTIFNQKLLL